MRKNDKVISRVVLRLKRRTKGAESFKQITYKLRPRNYKIKAVVYYLDQHVFSKETTMHLYNEKGRKETIIYYYTKVCIYIAK